jgi:hypothetical protein
MDLVVAFLVGWIANRAKRVGDRVGENVDQAAVAAVDRVWAIVAAKVGVHPALVRLRGEAAQLGAVSPQAREESEQMLQAAADQDPKFGDDLRAAVLEAMNQSARAQQAPPQVVHNLGGNHVGNVTAGGSVKINQKIVNYARRHPVPFTAIVIAVIGLMTWAGYGVVNVVSASDTDGSQPGSVTSATDVLATGSRSACGLREDRTVICWGEGGEYIRPSGQFSSIAVNNGTACGLRTDKTVTCWDGSPGRTSTGPSPTPRPVVDMSSPDGQFEAITAGCGVRPDGTIECWIEDVEPPAGKFTSITSGQYGAVCALKEDKGLSCWGSDRLEVVEKAPSSGSFVAVSVGGYHACALHEDHTVACWGKNDEGQASPPAGTFTAVTTGEEHSCGLRTDQSVVCWGRAKDGQTSPPSGGFATLGRGTGGEYSCGTRPDRTVECWGRKGKVIPPPGQLLVR